MLCDSAGKEQSDSVAYYTENVEKNECFVFGISKNKEAKDFNLIITNNSINNNSISNGGCKGKEFDCFDGVSEFIVNKSKEDKNSLNLNVDSGAENKESCGSKTSKISKIINENLCENSLGLVNNNNFISKNFNQDNFNFLNRNDFNPNLIQLGNLKINDSNNTNNNNISTTKNQMANLKNSCKIPI